jgi:hypothetical protein
MLPDKQLVTHAPLHQANTHAFCMRAVTMLLTPSLRISRCHPLSTVEAQYDLLARGAASRRLDQK